MNLKKFKNKKSFERIMYRILEKITDVIFYPLRIFYKYYEKSDIRKKINAKKYEKIMYKKIYSTITEDEEVYLVDFYIREEHSHLDILSTRNVWGGYKFSDVKYYKGINETQLLEEIIEKLSKDDMLEVDKVKRTELLKYGYENESEYIYVVRIKSK